MDKSHSDKHRFEGTRGGVHHRYEVQADALHYSAGEGSYAKEALIPWHDVTGLRAGRGNCVYLVRSNKQSFGVWLSPADLDAFLSAAIAAWGKVSPEAARKAAFDYGTAAQSVGWIWLVVSLIFPGMLALILLSDGYHELHCNRKLGATGQVAQAHVTRIKKNRRGNFIWTMEFDTADGHHVKGTRESPITDADGAPNRFERPGDGRVCAGRPFLLGSQPQTRPSRPQPRRAPLHRDHGSELRLDLRVRGRTLLHAQRVAHPAPASLARDGARGRT